MPDGTDTQTTQTTTTQATQVSEAWYTKAGVDAETIGHWQNKGWDVSKPETVALNASKAYREAERMIGMKADHDMLPIPKDPAKGDMGAVWARLGKPKEANAYTFDDVKFKDGTALDDSFVNTMREGLFRANVPANAAPEIVKTVVKFMDDAESRELSEKTATIATQRTELAKNWGTTVDKLANSPQMMVAKLAANRLGIDPETVNNLENVIGYDKIMQMFLNIGSKMGEDKYITGDGKGVGNGGVMSQEQAVARKSELKNDQAWVKKFLAGDNEAIKEMAALDKIITGA